MSENKKPVIAGVFSGGGAKGIYQATIIHKLYKEFGIEFDVVAGVSVGALNASMVACRKIDRLVELWDEITADDIYEKRSVARLLLNYAMHKAGIAKPLRGAYTNDPLYELIQRELTFEEIQIPLEIGRVDLLTREYRSDISPEYFYLQLLSSTAIPIVWEPVEMEGGLYVDGGVRDITPINDVLKYDPDLIIIIPTEPFEKENRAVGTTYRSSDLVEIASGSLGIILNELFFNDIDKFLTYNNIVEQLGEGRVTTKSGKILKNYDHLIIPPSYFIGDGLNFSREELERRKQHAYKVFDSMGEDGKFAILEDYIF